MKTTANPLWYIYCEVICKITTCIWSHLVRTQRSMKTNQGINLNSWLISCDLVTSFIPKQPSTINKVRKDFWHILILVNNNKMTFENGSYSKYLFWCATNHWVIKRIPIFTSYIANLTFCLLLQLKNNNKNHKIPVQYKYARSGLHIIKFISLYIKFFIYFDFCI